MELDTMSPRILNEVHDNDNTSMISTPEQDLSLGESLKKEHGYAPKKPKAKQIVPPKALGKQKTECVKDDPKEDGQYIYLQGNPNSSIAKHMATNKHLAQKPKSAPSLPCSNRHAGPPNVIKPNISLLPERINNQITSNHTNKSSNRTIAPNVTKVTKPVVSVSAPLPSKIMKKVTKPSPPENKSTEKQRFYDPIQVKSFMEQQREVRKMKEKKEKEEQRLEAERRKKHVLEIQHKQKDLISKTKQSPKQNESKDEHALSLATKIYRARKAKSPSNPVHPKIVISAQSHGPSTNQRSHELNKTGSKTTLEPKKKDSPPDRGRVEVSISKVHTDAELRTNLLLQEFESAVHRECLKLTGNEEFGKNEASASAKSKIAAESRPAIKIVSASPGRDTGGRQSRAEKRFPIPTISTESHRKISAESQQKISGEEFGQTFSEESQQRISGESPMTLAEKREKAATVIQAAYRGYKIRKIWREVTEQSFRRNPRRISFYRSRSLQTSDTARRRLPLLSPAHSPIRTSMTAVRPPIRSLESKSRTAFGISLEVPYIPPPTGSVSGSSLNFGSPKPSSRTDLQLPLISATSRLSIGGSRRSNRFDEPFPKEALKQLAQSPLPGSSPGFSDHFLRREYASPHTQVNMAFIPGISELLNPAIPTFSMVLKEKVRLLEEMQHSTKKSTSGISDDRTPKKRSSRRSRPERSGLAIFSYDSDSTQHASILSAKSSSSSVDVTITDDYIGPGAEAMQTAYNLRKSSRLSALENNNRESETDFDISSTIPSSFVFTTTETEPDRNYVTTRRPRGQRQGQVFDKLKKFAGQVHEQVSQNLESQSHPQNFQDQDQPQKFQGHGHPQNGQGQTDSVQIASVDKKQPLEPAAEASLAERRRKEEINANNFQAAEHAALVAERDAKTAEREVSLGKKVMELENQFRTMDAKVHSLAKLVPPPVVEHKKSPAKQNPKIAEIANLNLLEFAKCQTESLKATAEIQQWLAELRRSSNDGAQHLRQQETANIAAAVYAAVEGAKKLGTEKSADGRQGQDVKAVQTTDSLLQNESKSLNYSIDEFLQSFHEDSLSQVTDSTVNDNDKESLDGFLVQKEQMETRNTLVQQFLQTLKSEQTELQRSASGPDLKSAESASSPQSSASLPEISISGNSAIRERPVITFADVLREVKLLSMLNSKPKEEAQPSRRLFAEDEVSTAFEKSKTEAPTSFENDFESEVSQTVDKEFTTEFEEPVSTSSDFSQEPKSAEESALVLAVKAESESSDRSEKERVTSFEKTEIEEAVAEEKSELKSGVSVLEKPEDITEDESVSVVSKKSELDEHASFDENSEKAETEPLEFHKSEKSVTDFHEFRESEKSISENSEREKSEKSRTENSEFQKSEKSRTENFKFQESEKSRAESPEREKSEKSRTESSELQKSEKSRTESSELQKSEKSRTESSELQKSEKSGTESPALQKSDETGTAVPVLQKSEKSEHPPTPHYPSDLDSSNKPVEAEFEISEKFEDESEIKSEDEHDKLNTTLLEKPISVVEQVKSESETVSAVSEFFLEVSKADIQIEFSVEKDTLELTIESQGEKSDVISLKVAESLLSIPEEHSSVHHSIQDEIEEEFTEPKDFPKDSEQSLGEDSPSTSTSIESTKVEKAISEAEEKYLNQIEADVKKESSNVAAIGKNETKEANEETAESEPEDFDVSYQSDFVSQETSASHEFFGTERPDFPLDDSTEEQEEHEQEYAALLALNAEKGVAEIAADKLKIQEIKETQNVSHSPTSVSEEKNTLDESIADEVSDAESFSDEFEVGGATTPKPIVAEKSPVSDAEKSTPDGSLISDASKSPVPYISEVETPESVEDGESKRTQIVEITDDDLSPKAEIGKDSKPVGSSKGLGRAYSPPPPIDITPTEDMMLDMVEIEQYRTERGFPVQKPWRKWCVRERDIVDHVLVGEMLQENRSWIDFRDDISQVKENLVNRISRRAIAETLKAISQGHS